MNNDYVYNIFHLEGESETDKQRSELFNIADTYMSKYYKKLDTPSIRISYDKQYKNFLASEPEFKIDGAGARKVIGHEGWKYGEVGIWASNYTAWKNFLKTDAKYLILMEDDIKLHSIFSEILEDFISQLPEDFDMFSMFAPEDQWFLYNQSLDINQNDVCKSYQDWSMLCYVLTRKGAEKAIQSVHDGIFMPIDWHFFKQLNKFNVYTVKPKSGFCWLAQIKSTFQEDEYRRIIYGNFEQ